MGYIVVHAGGDRWACPCGWAMTAPEHDELAQTVAESHAATHEEHRVSPFMAEFLLGVADHLAQRGAGGTS